jgi:hypothetical protein
MVQPSAIEASHWYLLTGHARRNVDTKATDGAKLGPIDYAAVGWSSVRINLLRYCRGPASKNSHGGRLLVRIPLCPP